MWKGTVTTTTNAHTYILTLTKEDGTTAVITYNVANPPDTTVTLVATGIITAWNASTDPEVARITATQLAGQVILTADSAGVPFTVAATGTGTWSGTGNTTANAGPNDWNTAANWSTGAKPVNSDDVLISGRMTEAILYGLYQASLTIGRLVIDMGATEQIGTETVSLRLAGATSVRIGDLPFDGGNPGGSSLINLHTGSGVATSFVIAGTKSGGTAGRPPVMLNCTHASTRLAIEDGQVGFGVAVPGQSGTLLKVFAAGGKLAIGTGITLNGTGAEIDVVGGEVLVQSAFKLIKQYTGETTLVGTFAGEELDIRSGTVFGNNRASAGATFDALKLNGNSARLNVRGDARALTITATTPQANAPGKVLSTTTTQVTHTDTALTYRETAEGAESNTPDYIG